MALLVELTIGSDTIRVSNEPLALEHYWDPYLSSASSINWKMASDYGGHVKVNFSNFSLLPKTFENHWPAPTSFDISIKYTESNEASAITLFEGAASSSGLDRESNSYELYGEDIDYTLTGAVLNDTLVNIFSSGASLLGLTLNSSAARSPSPAVLYTASGQQQVLGILNDVAKFFTHCFYINGGVLYLVDMLQDNGSRTLTEFDFEPINYREATPLSFVSSDSTKVKGSSSFGDVVTISPVCHSDGGAIGAALANIKTILEYRQAEVTIPFGLSSNPTIGEKISWTDESFDQDIDMYIRTYGISYNFDRYDFTVIGPGVMS